MRDTTLFDESEGAYDGWKCQAQARRRRDRGPRRGRATELRAQLESGKTLAQIAKSQNKSVDGLVSALVTAKTKELDAAVKAGRLTKAEEQTLLSNLKQHITDMVNGVRPTRPPFRPEGFRGGQPFAHAPGI